MAKMIVHHLQQQQQFRNFRNNNYASDFYYYFLLRGELLKRSANDPISLIEIYKARLQERRKLCNNGRRLLSGSYTEITRWRFFIISAQDAGSQLY